MEILALTVGGLAILASYYASFLLGRLHKCQGRLRERWDQGYNTGCRVGWYDAAEQVYKDSLTFREEYANLTGNDFRSLDYINGYEAAGTRLERFWDKLDKQS